MLFPILTLSCRYLAYVRRRGLSLNQARVDPRQSQEPPRRRAGPAIGPLTNGDAGRHRPRGRPVLLPALRFHPNGALWRRFRVNRANSAIGPPKRAQGPFPAETGPPYARLAKQRRPPLEMPHPLASPKPPHPDGVAGCPDWRGDQRFRRATRWEFADAHTATG